MRKLLLLLLLAAPLARAEAMPRFSAEDRAWSATHIVVVSEGEVIDGEVEVLDSWYGDLRRGQRITVESLREFVSPESRAIERAWYQPEDEARPTVATNQRMVLFLERDGETWKPAESRTGWMKISMAWIEDDRVYGLNQPMNPGPLMRIDLGETEADLEKKVRDTVRAKDALRADLQALPELYREASLWVRLLLIRELEAHAAAGIPGLRYILSEPAYLNDHHFALSALRKAGGAEVTVDFVQVLREELAFWRAADPAELEKWRKHELPVERMNHFGAHASRLWMARAVARERGIEPELVAACAELGK